MRPLILLPCNYQMGSNAAASPTCILWASRAPGSAMAFPKLSARWTARRISRPSCTECIPGPVSLQLPARI